MRRLSRLDGLRGILAVYVMLGHALPFTSLPGWATAPFAHGEAAVDLFFALSGLVITGAAARHQGRFLPFMAARARRLLPVYFIALALAVLILCFGPPALPWLAARPMARDILGGGLPHPFVWHLAAHLTLVQGALPQGLLPFAYVTLLGPAWSLSTEFQFYLVIGLSARRAGGGQAGAARLALLLLALACLWHVLSPRLPAYWQFSRAFLPDAAGYFALGMASAVWLRGGGAAPLALCAGGLGLLAIFMGTPGRLLIPLAWLLVLRTAAPGKSAPLLNPLARLLDSRAAQTLGAISYPLYLLNEPLQRLAMCLLGPLGRANPAAFTLFWLPVALAAPLAAAALLHRTVERHPSLTPPRAKKSDTVTTSVQSTPSIRAAAEIIPQPEHLLTRR
jgi:peptidoglycan/LPS O-acetylase OafA/YrhL